MAQESVRQKIPMWARKYVVDVVRARVRKAGLNPDDYAITMNGLRGRILRMDGGALTEREITAIRGAL